MRIWKFELAIEGEQEIEMPKMATILYCDVQQEQICLWALVDPTADKTMRSFHVVGTGHDFNSYGLRYIGSCQMAEGKLVWHVFE